MRSRMRCCFCSRHFRHEIWYHQRERRFDRTNILSEIVPFGIHGTEGDGAWRKRLATATHARDRTVKTHVPPIFALYLRAMLDG